MFSIMESLKSRVTPALVLTVGILYSATGVEAHGNHNMEKIQEGESMSVDPIVCWLRQWNGRIVC